MNKKNLVRLFMMQSVNSFANTNPAITNLIPAFRNGNTRIGSIINQVLNLSGGQSQTIFGTGNQKDLMRDALNAITYNCIKATRGWALTQNDLDLAGQLNYSPSRIKRISDKNIAQRAAYWLGLVDANIANLTDWNITPQTILDWQAAIADYIQVLELPKTAKETRKSKTEQINMLIKQGMEFCLNILDAAAIGFKTNGNSAFYNQYKNYRKLDNLASKIGKFRVLIVDELNQPIANALLQQNGTQNKITTDIYGHASLNIIYNKNVDKNQMDLYSFTLTLGTNTINTGLISIKKNQTESRTYVMAPSGFIIPAYLPAPVQVPA